MAEQVIKDAKLWFEGYELSGDMNALALNYSCALQEKPVFNVGAVKRLPGLVTAAFQHEGFWNTTPDEQFFSKIGAVNAVMSAAPNNGADGERAFFLKCLMGEYSPGGSVGEMFAFSVAGESDDRFIRGTVMHNSTRTASGNGTARQLGAVSSTQKLYASLHIVTASAADTLDVSIYSDDNIGMTTPTLRGSFTQASAIGAQWLTPISGAITDDYWQVRCTIAGTSPSFEFVVVIGIL